MVKIYIPSVNEEREITQIVAFGCSMTQGAELLDHERYPDLNVEALKKISLIKWGEFKIKNRLENEEEFLHREGQLAWPAQLSKEYEIPCYNFAQGASGFAQQITQFLRAHRQGLITPTTLVVWGLTSKERGLWVQDYTVQSYMINGMLDPPELRDHHKEFWYTYANNDYLTLWYYYQHLNTMLTWAESLCNNQFMFIHSLAVNLDLNKMPVWEEEKNFKNPKYKEFMVPFWNIISSKYNKYHLPTDPTHTFFDWAKKIPNGLLGGKHPTVDVHKEYAKFLIQEIETRRLARLTSNG